NLLRAAAERVDRQQLVRVVAGGDVGGPADTAAARLEQLGVEARFDPRVLHAADVGREDVREVGTGRDGHRKDQVGGLLVVPVDRAGEPLIRETEIDADVVGAGRL